jgi:hypothetical protein
MRRASHRVPPGFPDYPLLLFLTASFLLEIASFMDSYGYAGEAPAPQPAGCLRYLLHGYRGYFWDVDLQAYDFGIGMVHETTQLFGITHE